MQILESHSRSKHKEIFWKVKDRNYLSLWDKNDLPAIDKWQAKIRQTHDEQLIKEFFRNLDRKWDDHRSNFVIEPIDLGVKDDVLTFKGVARFCRLITKQDNTTARNVAVGTGAALNSRPMPFQQSLISEVNHVHFDTNGFFDATGTSIRYGGTFGESMGTANYNESLVRDTDNDGDSGRVTFVMAMFFDNPISHTQGNTGFTAAGSIEFLPVADDDTRP